MKKRGLSKEQLLAIFTACIENALSLWTLAIENIKNEKTRHISLGLSELALEELGKSYTCLSYYCLTYAEEMWPTFWKDWKNHIVKAHRAFFYEFFSLLRLETKDSVKFVPTGRGSIPTEKEVSFYVDFDYLQQRIIIPISAMDNDELVHRVSSVMGPLNAALQVNKMMKENEDDDYRNAISNYALHTITSNMYTQDVQNVISKMKKGIPAYDKALDDIWILFNSNKEEI